MLMSTITRFSQDEGLALKYAKAHLPSSAFQSRVSLVLVKATTEMHFCILPTFTCESLYDSMESCWSSGDMMTYALMTKK